MNFFKRIALKILSRKVDKALGLQEGTPVENGKPWYKSKAVLSAIVVILIGGYETAKTTLAPALGINLPDIPPFVYSILGALGLWGRLTATQTITK